MANQHKSALQHAADGLRPRLFDLGIVVLPHLVICLGVQVEVKPGTTQKECRRILKKIMTSVEKINTKELQGALL